MSYDYKKNTGKNEKFARKIMHENDVPDQLNVKLNTKKIKNLPLHCFAGDNNCKINDAHYCDTVKRKQKTTKMSQIYKNHENWFYENWLSQEERPFEENKPFMKSVQYFNR